MKTDQFIKTGNYHISRGEECQDKVYYSENGAFAVAVIADGATSCRCSARGADIACRAVLDFIACEKERIFSYPEEKLAYLLIEHVLYFLERETRENGAQLHDYASTLMMTCVELMTGRAILFNLGDGAILSLEGSSFTTRMEPKRISGHPCLTTINNAYKFAEVKTIELQFGEGVLLCSDGLLNVLSSDIKFSAVLKECMQNKDFIALNDQLEHVCEMDDIAYIAVVRTRN